MYKKFIIISALFFGFFGLEFIAFIIFRYHGAVAVILNTIPFILTMFGITFLFIALFTGSMFLFAYKKEWKMAAWSCAGLLGAGLCLLSAIQTA